MQKLSCNRYNYKANPVIRKMTLRLATQNSDTLGAARISRNKLLMTAVTERQQRRCNGREHSLLTKIFLTFTGYQIMTFISIIHEEILQNQDNAFLIW